MHVFAVYKMLIIRHFFNLKIDYIECSLLTLLNKMPSMNRRIIFFFCLFALHSISIKAQTTRQSSISSLSAKDSLILKNGKASAFKFYEMGIGSQAGKFNGSQAPSYKPAVIEKNPYYAIAAFKEGSIDYENMHYNHVQLMYDEVADVVLLSDSTHQIQLIKEKLQSFTIGSDKFINIWVDSNVTNLYASGYYQALAEGPVSLLKKEIKKVRDRIIGTEIFYQIDVTTDYYVKENQNLYLIDWKKAIIKILNNKSQELRKYINSERLNYNKDKEAMLIKVVNYYNLLNN